MFKVNFKDTDNPSTSFHFFKIFKTKKQADEFIREIGSRFISVKAV